MTILGIEQITYRVTDLDTCRRFLGDWGLTEVSVDANGARFETLNGCRVLAVRHDDPSLPPAMEDGPTLREVTWGVTTAEEVAAIADRFADQPGYYFKDGATGCVDPNGLAVRVEVTAKRAVDVKGALSNPWGSRRSA